MKKAINRVDVQGYVYQIAARQPLTIKTVQNSSSPNYGKEFINGNLEVAVDEEGLNVLTIHFTYVTAEGKNGHNRTFDVLKEIIDNPGKNWVSAGKDGAYKVSINTSVALNDFIGRDGQLASAKVIEGGFVDFVSTFDEKKRNAFKVDMLINKVTHVEADPERRISEDYTVIGGAVFNFRGEILPMSFNVHNPQGMEFFEGLDASAQEPVFICVWGNINSQTIKIERVEESAFGEALVTYTETKNREWAVTGASRAPYDFGEEGVLTVEELKEAMQNRQTHLAEVKQRDEEYKASRAVVQAKPGELPFSAKTEAFEF
jgi:hypothetical protein